MKLPATFDCARLKLDAQNPPLDVSNTSQFRDVANSSSRIFGWNTKGVPQTQFNQVVITQEELAKIRELRASMAEEEKDQIAKGKRHQRDSNNFKK